MKKKASLLFTLLLILSLCLSACGDKGGAKSGGPAELPMLSEDLSQYVELGQYTGIELPKKTAEVSDEALQNAIRGIQENNPRYHDSESGIVEKGDLVSIDYAGTMNGESFEGGTGSYDLLIGSGSFIPGFEDGLIGAAQGETRKLDLTFPDPYINNPEYSGKPVTFEVTVKRIQQQNEPVWNDEYVASLEIEGVKTAAEYEAKLRAEMLEEEQATLDEAWSNELWGIVMENANVLEYPEERLNDVLADASAYYEAYAQNNGLELEDFVSTYLGMDMDAYNSWVEEQAKASLKQELVFYSIAQAEGMEISAEDYQAGIANYLERFGFADEAAFKEKTGQTFEEMYGSETITQSLLWERVLDLVESSAVTE